jgi:2'-5' RNA ligase
MDLLGLLEGSSSSSSSSCSSSEEKSEDGAHKEDDQADDSNNKVAEKEKKNEHPNKKPKLGSVNIVLSSEAPNLFVRSVPHRRGHWSGHVLVPITCFTETSIRKSVVKFQRRLEKQGYSGTVIQHAHFHLSLSRYFSLQLTFLDSFVQQLTKRLKEEHSTRLYIHKSSGEVLVNDEKTRSFWGWKIQPNNILKRLVQHVDDVLKNYNQPPYYDPPIFHVSLASFAGNLEDFENNTHEEDESSSEEEDDDEEDNDCYIQVDQIHCKFGTTKNYVIDLQPP